MLLRYEGKKKLVMLPTHNLWVTDGLEVEASTKKDQKMFKEIGFKEVKKEEDK